MKGYMNCPICDGDTITLNAWVDDDGVQCGIEWEIVEQECSCVLEDTHPAIEAFVTDPFYFEPPGL
jgi:hypothetical protein